jgi:hypothetical protein
MVPTNSGAAGRSVPVAVMVAVGALVALAVAFLWPR